MTDSRLRCVVDDIDRYSADSLSNTRLTVDWLSTDYRPCLDRVSTESRPTIDRYIDRMSTDYRPLYRPINRSTLPTVTMILSAYIAKISVKWKFTKKLTTRINVWKLPNKEQNEKIRGFPLSHDPLRRRDLTIIGISAFISARVFEKQKHRFLLFTKSWISKSNVRMRILFCLSVSRLSSRKRQLSELTKKAWENALQGLRRSNSKSKSNSNSYSNPNSKDTLLPLWSRVTQP